MQLTNGVCLLHVLALSLLCASQKVVCSWHKAGYLLAKAACTSHRFSQNVR